MAVLSYPPCLLIRGTIQPASALPLCGDARVEERDPTGRRLHLASPWGRVVARLPPASDRWGSERSAQLHSQFHLTGRTKASMRVSPRDAVTWIAISRSP